METCPDDNARFLEAVDQVIFILESARLRKNMYFYPIDSKAAEHWIDGLRTGLDVFGLRISPDFRLAALTRRGLGLASKFETDDLAERGLSTIEIVDELLAIEIEMWQAFRESLASSN